MLTAAKDALAAPRPHGAFHLSGKGGKDILEQPLLGDMILSKWKVRVGYFTLFN